MPSDSEDNQTRLHSALRNPTRRRIIELLGEEGSLRFSELKESLNVPVGTLYYHFEALNELVIQDADKRYALSGRGWEVYQSSRRLSEPSDPRIPQPQGNALPRAPMRRGLDAYSWILQSPSRSVPIFFATIFAGSLVSAFSVYFPLLFFFEYSAGLNILKAFSFIVGWLALFLGLELSVRAGLKRRGETWKLAVTTALGIIPLLLFPVAQQLLGLIGSEIGTLLVLGIAQGSSFILLTLGLSNAKGVGKGWASFSTLTVFTLNALVLFLADFQT